MTSEKEGVYRMRKRVLIVFATLVVALGFATPSTLAMSSPAAAMPTTVQAQVTEVVTADVGELACTYKTKRAIDVFSRPDHSSGKVGSIGAGVTLFNKSCSNTTGGWYSFCSTSNQWKWIDTGWVQTKCLTLL